LHFHTSYSLLDGACQVKKTMDRAHELGMPAVAMTDHGVLFGAVEFYKEAKAKGIKPLIGCEVYIAFGSMHERKVEPGRGYANHFVLLAENEEGYANLMRLVSLSHLEGFYYKPRIDKELLSQHHKGLIGLAACLKGEVAELCVQGKIDKAEKVACEFRDIMGEDNFFLEIQDHGIPEQRVANKGILEIAKRTGLPIVATNDVHYLKAEHAEAHEVMLCLQTQTVMSDPKRMRYGSDQFYMKSAEEMWALFGEVPESLTNTMDIARRCNVELSVDGKQLHFPVYELPDGFEGPHADRKYLIWLGHEGIKERYDMKDPAHPADEREADIVKRFDYEMSIIERTGFINYFLVVSDFIHYAKAQGIPVGPGRGSGAGSLVAYSLGITGIDPLYYNLIFERFLNPERVSPPDFDIDFCQSRRGEVIEYVKDKYGRENVAQIITFGTLGAKTVIRDIGRVLEIDFSLCDKLAKMIPEDPKMTLQKALDENQEFKKITETEEYARRIMKYARVLEGLPRQTGTHAAGVVIGEKPLIELLPLARDKNKEPVTQFEMKPMESTGLLKMDFLGLKTLTIIKETVQNIKKTKDIDLDIEALPMDDKKTFELLCRGDTIGVFQVESPGMRDLLRNLGPTIIQDLIALIALFRPGPMDMIPDFIKRKHGQVKITYDHPLLEEILKETYGIMIYQEQVQQAANKLAGFSLGQGDILRRAMGKKNTAEMATQRTKFIDGCKDTNNITAKLSGSIFDNIEKFAGYGFNKSHSAAYGIISYQTAYLKAHHPVEFVAALLSMEIGNADKIPVFIAEAKEMDIEVLPPSVNDSFVRFSPMGRSIRFGMAGIKNVGEGAVCAIVEEREENGPFKSLIDFCSRLDSHVVNRKVIESLVKCGAFDFTKMSRGRLFNGVDFAISRAASALKDKQCGQITLFDILLPTNEEQAAEELPPAEPWPTHEMLSAEKELLGFYISGHPLKEFEWALQHFTLARIASVNQLKPKSATRVGGLITQFTRRITKKSKRPMGIFKLEGLEGAVEVVVFPDAYESCSAILQEEQAVMVCGERDQGDELKIKADEVYLLGQAHRLFAHQVYLHVSETAVAEGQLDAVQDILSKHTGTTPVVICIQFTTGEKVFIDAGKTFEVEANEHLVHALHHELGEESIYIDPVRKARLKEPKRNGWGKKSGGRSQDSGVRIQ